MVRPNGVSGPDVLPGGVPPQRGLPAGDGLCLWGDLKGYTVKNSAKDLSKDHDSILIYARNKSLWQRNRLGRTATMDARYANFDDDPRGAWKAKPLQANKPYSKGLYSITTPGGRLIQGPPPGTYWRISEQEL